MFDFDAIIDRSNTDSYKMELRQQTFGNPNVLPLWVADMDFATPPMVRKVIQERARHEIFGYTVRPQLFKESIVAWIEKRFQWSVDTQWIAYSPGVVPALTFSILALTQPGDNIIIQPPIYPPFFSVVKKSKRQLLCNPLVRDEKGVYRFDLTEFEQMAAMPETKMFILCHPHNPVGREWSKEELTAIGNICIKHGVTILSDEIHADLMLFENKHVPFASLNDEFAMNSLTFMAPSKSFNIPGLNTSYVVSKNKEMLDKYLQMLDALHLNLGHVFGSISLETAYNHCEAWLDEMLAYVSENVVFVNDFLKSSMPQVGLTMPEATYLLWLDFTNMQMTQNDLRQLIYHKAGVGINDGVSFGKEGVGFMRMNVASPRSLVNEGLERIADAIHSLT